MQMAEEVAHKAGVGEWRPSYGSAFVCCRAPVVWPFVCSIIRLDSCICLRVLICLVHALCCCARNQQRWHTKGWFHRFMKRHGLWDKHLRLRSRLGCHQQQEQEEETDDEDEEDESHDEATSALRQEDRERPCPTRNLASNPLGLAPREIWPQTLSSLSMLPPPSAVGIEGAQSSGVDSLLAHALLQLNGRAPASLIAPKVPPLGPIAHDDWRGGTQVRRLVAKPSLVNAPHQPLVAIGTQGHGWPALHMATAPTPMPDAAAEVSPRTARPFATAIVSYHQSSPG